MSPVAGLATSQQMLRASVFGTMRFLVRKWRTTRLLQYLTDVLRCLPALSSDDHDGITLLLPHHWAQAHPEHVLTERVQESAAATRRRRARRAARRLAAAE
jgi:hypothetical protein